MATRIPDSLGVAAPLPTESKLLRDPFFHIENQRHDTMRDLERLCLLQYERRRGKMHESAIHENQEEMMEYQMLRARILHDLKRLEEVVRHVADAVKGEPWTWGEKGIAVFGLVASWLSWKNGRDSAAQFSWISLVSTPLLRRIYGSYCAAEILDDIHKLSEQIEMDLEIRCRAREKLERWHWNYLAWIIGDFTKP